MGDQSSAQEQSSAEWCRSDGILCQCQHLVLDPVLVLLTHHLLDGHADCYSDNKSLIEAGHIENMMQSLVKLLV